MFRERRQERREERREERRGDDMVQYKMRLKIVAIGDDFWIEDSAGRRAYKVDGKALRARLASRRTALKVALMDQRLVVGVGNIYSSESLFRARLAPQRPAGGLSTREAGRLATAIRRVLEEAILVLAEEVGENSLEGLQSEVRPVAPQISH